jgi:hypothetical protein
MDSKKSKAELKAELETWRTTWTQLVQGYKRQGKKVSNKNLPPDLAAADTEIYRLERELSLFTPRASSSMINISFRLDAPSVSRALDIVLSSDEAVAVWDAAEKARLPLGGYCRAIIAGTLGEEQTTAIARKHAEEIGIPLRTFLRVLVLAGAGYRDEGLDEYRKIAAKVGEKL